MKINWWRFKEFIGPHWIVNEYGEMGMRWFWINFYYYKYDTPLIYGGRGEEKPPRWRYASKREFGECVFSEYGFGNPGNSDPDMVIQKDADGTITVLK